MRYKIFQSPWIDKADYIINLTRHVIGEHNFSKLAGQTITTDKGIKTLLFLFGPRIIVELSNMSNETLGSICAYGTERGFHFGPPAPASFLNLTGFRDVMKEKFDVRMFSGRDTLTEMASSVIICVARDIIMQDVWQTQLAGELQANDRFEKGLEDCIHGRKST